MRRLILVPVLLLLLAATPLDVREIWQPLPHPSMPIRDPVLTGLGPPTQGPPDGSPNVVLITVDTWRADRLGLHGSARDTSPWLDAFATNAVVFDRARAPAPWTWPTMVSLATGLHPRSHGVIKPDHLLCAEADTLAEAMHRGGWRTGFSGVNTYFEPEANGYRQGFEFFWVGGSGIYDKVLEYARYFLDGAGRDPFFLHTHFFDPHCPYDPAEALLRRMQETPQGAVGLRDGDKLPPFEFELQVSSTCHSVPPLPEHLHEAELLSFKPSHDRQDYFDYYDAELVEVDTGMAELQKALEESGDWDDSWVVITGDHGEEFGEHGAIGHGENVHAETTWVPLVIRPPKGVEFKPGRVATPVSLVDVPVTILAALGRAVPSAMQGRSLLPALQGQDLDPKPVLTETLYRRDSWGASIDWSGLRFVVGGAPAKGHVFTADDPMEIRDGLVTGELHLQARAHGLAALLREELQALSAQRVCSSAQLEVDPTHWEALQKLGYLVEDEPELVPEEPPTEAPEPPLRAPNPPPEPDPDKRVQD